jgi:hypothetical protein
MRKNFSMNGIGSSRDVKDCSTDGFSLPPFTPANLSSVRRSQSPVKFRSDRSIHRPSCATYISLTILTSTSS